MLPFDSPENIRTPKVFWFFEGDQKATLERKGLRHFCLTFLALLCLKLSYLLKWNLHPEEESPDICYQIRLSDILK